MSNPYIYIFVREDLSKCQQIIQAAHAVDEMNANLIDPNAAKVTNYMVLCPAVDEWELHDISVYLKECGIKFHKFYETDIEGHTAIATVPLVGEQRAPMRAFSTMK